MSYIITRRKGDTFQMYCDYSEWPLGWAAFCKGISDLNWCGRTERGINLPRQFRKEDDARHCLTTYLQKKEARNELGDIHNWHFEVAEYLR